MTIRTAAALLPALVVAACATTQAPSPPARSAWRVQSSATAGAALVLSGGGGEDVLRLACRRAPSDLYLASDRLKPARGPVTLQVGEHSFTLQAVAEGAHLAAVAPIPDALPSALMNSGAIRVSAGAQHLEGLPTPEGTVVAAFVIACRAETATG